MAIARARREQWLLARCLRATMVLRLERCEGGRVGRMDGVVIGRGRRSASRAVRVGAGAVEWERR